MIISRCLWDLNDGEHLTMMSNMFQLRVAVKRRNVTGRNKWLSRRILNGLQIGESGKQAHSFSSQTQTGCPDTMEGVMPLTII